VLERYPETRFALLSSPEHADEAEALAAVDPGRIAVFPPSPDVLNVCAAIELCDVVVSPDTSIVHIGAAFDRPVLALYTRLRMTTITEWIPYGVPYRAVMTRERRPLDTIPVQEVVDAFGELVHRAGDGDPPRPRSARR
jgi:ADP-heptose:LPS heptosyltransferase